MIERKPLYWFLGISFVISWSLFLVPLVYRDAEPMTRQVSMLVSFSLAMWGPGIAALVVTRWVERLPLRSLGLNRLGPRRYYLWAWLLPPVLSLLAGIFTLLFGFGELDLNLTMIRSSIPADQAELPLPLVTLVVLQAVAAILVAPYINMIFAMGEELGWRGYLLPKLMPLGQWKAILLSGVIWGVWHAPAIAQGHNYPGYPVLGMFMMVVFTVLLGAIFSWLYLNTRSPWSAALAHGAVNASGALPVLFLNPGLNVAFGGTLASVSGWVGIALFVAWLVRTRRLPVGTVDPQLAEVVVTY